jgi:dienelactone hydrolase
MVELRRVTAGRFMDLQLILNVLSLWDDHDPLLAHHLDWENIGTMGFSHGGNAAIELGRLEPRCRAVVLLDAYLYGLDSIRTNKLPVPMLQMYQAFAENVTGFDSVQSVYTNSASNAYYCQVRGAEHASFSDLRDVAVAHTTNRRAEEVVRACVLSFFDRHLKGTQNTLLDAPANAFPNISKFKRK